METDKIDYDKTEQYIRSIRKEWERFIEKGVADKEIIRPIVLESWKRSKEWGVDPKKNTIISLNGKELDNKLEENRELIKISSPLLEILARSVRGSGFRIDLFSKDVYILKQWGDRETLENSRKLGSFPGVCKSERLAGTNAIGLASYLKVPIQLIGPEHYCSQLQQ
ncbi:MAG TPA: hypothetical protein ENI51_00695 [Candidatus Atribacteria bacterium]|nr:hypothetical protein [Candidatus Atribacteria bacterium]